MASKNTNKVQKTRKIYHIMLLIFKHNLTILLLLVLTFKVSAQKNQPVVRLKITRIVNKLEKGKEVHFGYPVGIAGLPETNNKYYKLYQKLKRKATNAELIRLTKSKSEIITIYAFNILHSRNYEGLKYIFFRHIRDTTLFWTAGGCTGIVGSVNWFMLRLLKPTNENGYRYCLTRSEYNMYRNQLEKGDYDFHPE